MITRLYRFKQKISKKQFIDIHITDHCNLNCKGCGHFSSVSQPYDMSLEEMEIACKKLKPILHKFFNSIHLMGGEPLLHPEVEGIMSLVRNYFPETEIQLITNGIKIPVMPESFWNTCRTNHIKIYVSRYPAGIDYERISQIIDTNEVEYELSGIRNKFIHHVYDPDGKQNPKESYSKCEFGGACLQFRDGKLFPCARAAYIPIFNKAFGQNYQYCKGDFIEVDKLKSYWQFWKFITRPIPFCRYCNMEKEHYEEWGKSKRKLEEWI